MDRQDSSVAHLIQGESWPPTQMHLGPAMEHNGDQKGGAHSEGPDLDLSRIDDDPLAYFLTNNAPSASSEDEDDEFRYTASHPFGGGARDRDPGDDFDFHMDFFDAGIEDANRPPPVIRSVSPSKLGGLLRFRPPTPPKSPATRHRSHGNNGGDPPAVQTPPTTEDDDYDDDDDSILSSGEVSDEDGAAYVTRHNLGLSFLGRRSLAAGRIAGVRGHDRTSNGPWSGMADALLSPSSFPVGGRRSGRPADNSRRPAVGYGTDTVIEAGGLGTPAITLRAAAAAAGSSSPLAPSARRSPRSWRQPSRSVWPIEEEDENQARADEDMAGSDADSWEGEASETRAVDIPGAKQGKRVRFVLPARDELRDQNEHGGRVLG